MSNLNWVDNLILIIFLGSMVIGLMRGFVKEIISLLTWFAAFMVAMMFSSKLAAAFTSSQSVQSAVSEASNTIGMSAAQPVSYLSLGISFIVLFVGTLLIGTLINSIMSRAVEMPGISFANRILGAVFGLARGFLLVIVTLFLVQLTSFAQQSAYTQSTLVGDFQPAVAWLSSMVEPGYNSLKQKVGNTLQNVNSQQLLNSTMNGV